MSESQISMEFNTGIDETGSNPSCGDKLTINQYDELI